MQRKALVLCILRVLRYEASMPTLHELLFTDEKKSAVIDDCCKLIDEEVASKTGISGAFLRTAYGAVKGIKPGFIKSVVTDLLPEFSVKLEPFFAEAKGAGKTMVAAFAPKSDAIAEALLSVTDEKVEHAKSGLVRSTYKSLRGTAKKNVEAALPRLAILIDKHTA
jgi:hypothetical protein